MHDDRGGGLLRLKLKLFRERYINARRIEQLKELGLIFKVRARRITETEARALIALMKKFRKLRGVPYCDTHLFADALVPEFREGLSRFNTETMKVEIVCVVVRAK